MRQSTFELPAHARGEASRAVAHHEHHGVDSPVILPAVSAPGSTRIRGVGRRGPRPAVGIVVIT
ncbi:MAG: hypothetical protein L0L69_10100, partial [Propionibacterium sp.]|nr:hypothetical protein [Propionibacterium sp.]